MDIDIDFQTTFDPLDIFDDAIRASMVNNSELKKHPAGIYFQNIPTDKITNLAAIPYDKAEELGYIKIDFLHISLLDHFKSKKEIRELIKIEPKWELLEIQENVEKLFQIHRHFDIVYQIKPKSVEDLADCIALIRPGKRYLLNFYLQNKKEARKELYKKPEDNKYYFKRSHALAYAFNIVLQLHLIDAGII